MCEISTDPAIRNASAAARTLADTARIHPQWPFPSPVCVYCGFAGRMCHCPASAFGRMLADHRNRGSRPGSDGERSAFRHLQTDEWEGGHDGADADTPRVWRSCGALATGDYSGSADIGEANIRFLTGENSPLRPGDYWEERGRYGHRQLWVIDTPRARSLVFAPLSQYPLLCESTHSEVQSEWEAEAVRQNGERELSRELGRRDDFWVTYLDEHPDAVDWQDAYRIGSEAANVYPEYESGGAYIRWERVAEGFAERVELAAEFVGHVTPTVAAIARGIIADGYATCRLPVLADALNDAGLETSPAIDSFRGLTPKDQHDWLSALLSLTSSGGTSYLDDFWFLRLVWSYREYLDTPTPEEAAEAEELERHVANRERTATLPGM